MTRLKFILLSIVAALFPWRSKSSVRSISFEEMQAYCERNTKAKAWLDANGFKSSLSPYPAHPDVIQPEYTVARVWYENEKGETAWIGVHVAFRASVGIAPWFGVLRNLASQNFVIEHRDPLLVTVTLDDNWNQVGAEEHKVIATYRFERPDWL